MRRGAGVGGEGEGGGLLWEVMSEKFNIIDFILITGKTQLFYLFFVKDFIVLSIYSKKMASSMASLSKMLFFLTISEEIQTKFHLWFQSCLSVTFSNFLYFLIFDFWGDVIRSIQQFA